MTFKMLKTRYYYVIVTILLAFVQISNSQSGKKDSFVEIPDFDNDNSSDYYDNTSDYFDSLVSYYDQLPNSEAVQFDGKYKLRWQNFAKTSKFLYN